MSKPKSTFVCSDCSAESPKWLGQCGGCGAWNTLEERRVDAATPTKNRFQPLACGSEPMSMRDIPLRDVDRTPTGIEELDRVLGGGVVSGSIALLGGDPGVGKSTLMLQALDGLSRQGLATLYITGEESGTQVAMRAKRMNMSSSDVEVFAETQLERILHNLETKKPFACVVDSIQTIYTSELSSAPGSVAQVRECAAHLTRHCKAHGTAVFCVGHVTKDGSIAGPKVLEHMVDLTAELTGEATSTYRILRATKNRFGAVNELGVFAMVGNGMRGVPNPSAIFLSTHAAPVAGSSVMAGMEGTRPLLVEIQALVDAGGPSPRRLSVGLERDRLAMLLAVLHRHAGIGTADQDVFVNAVGGVKVTEPASDLPVMLAIQSSLTDKPLPKGWVAFGEVGLAGEVRPAPRGQERLKEAAKLGFAHAIVPKANEPRKRIEGLTVHAVERVEEAVALLRNL